VRRSEIRKALNVQSLPYWLYSGSDAETCQGPNGVIPSPTRFASIFGWRQQNYQSLLKTVRYALTFQGCCHHYPPEKKVGAKSEREVNFDAVLLICVKKTKISA